MRKSQLLICTAVILLTVSGLGLFPTTHSQATIALDVAVSVQSIAGIVHEVGGVHVVISVLLPEGVEPHAFTLTQAVLDTANSADMLVLTGHFVWEEILANQTGKPYITLDDYEALGAELLSLHGASLICDAKTDSVSQHTHDENLHGYWLFPQNAIAIANATRILATALDTTYTQYWQDRFDEFVEEIAKFNAFLAQQKLIHELETKKVIATFPAEVYVAKTLGLEIKGLLMEGENIFISGPELLAIEQALHNGSIDLIIASDVAHLQAAGEFAQQLSVDSGVPLVWVRTVFSLLEDYIGLMAYNTGIIITGLSGAIPSASDFLTISMPIIIIATILGVIAVIEMVLLLRFTRTQD
ncbi:MAG: metal ABC transporter solute-binding protein, Zn/Mn family [Candidatus Thorarchaeota archaeon]